MLAANFWWEPGYNYIPAFFFSGGYQTTAEAVPPPLEVVQGEVGPDGTTQFSVAPLYGLQFVNPAEPYYFQNWPAGTVTWKFIRGENVEDDPRSPGGEAIPVNECGFQLTCSYRPPGLGRMQASAWIEGREVTVRSNPATTPEIQLTCNPLPVTRGNDLDCRASASPSGRLSDIRWEFRDSLGIVTRDSAGETWGGKMVVGGRMRVSAKLDGLLVQKDTAISISPRTWPSMTVVAVDSGNGHLPTHPTLIQHLADIHPPIPSAPVVIDTISTGPNAGWAYLAAPIASVTAIVHISAGFNPGTPVQQTALRHRPDDGEPVLYKKPIR